MRPTLMFVLCFLFIGCSVPSLHIRINTALLVKPEEPLCVSIAAASLPPPAHCRLFLTRDNLIVDMVEVTLNRHGDSVVLSIPPQLLSKSLTQHTGVVAHIVGRTSDGSLVMHFTLPLRQDK